MNIHSNYSSDLEFVPVHTIIITTALINITLELGTYNTAEGDGSVEVCAVLTSGMIEAGQSFTTLLETSPGSASTGKTNIN